ncbi:hypothetical protein EV14_0356 [Prochlorococcus sp. MIT 0703]|nr:hypothetical protein EV14_0356 [Prochlorococcus sp. MIT 0703]
MSGRCPSGSGRLGGATTGRFGLGRPTSSGFGALRSDGIDGLAGGALRPGAAGDCGLETILGRGPSPLTVVALLELDV